MGLDTVEFLMYADKEFDIKIYDEDTGNIYTVSEFSAVCRQKLATKPNNQTDNEYVFLKCKEILHQHFANTKTEITYSSKS